MSFGKMRQPPCVVPGPATAPELLVLGAPLDVLVVPRDDAELAAPDDDEDARVAASPLSPHATRMTIPTTTLARITVPLMV